MVILQLFSIVFLVLGVTSSNIKVHSEKNVRPFDCWCHGTEGGGGSTHRRQFYVYCDQKQSNQKFRQGRIFQGNPHHCGAYNQNKKNKVKFYQQLIDNTAEAMCPPNKSIKPTTWDGIACDNHVAITTKICSDLDGTNFMFTLQGCVEPPKDPTMGLETYIPCSNCPPCGLGNVSTSIFWPPPKCPVGMECCTGCLPECGCCIPENIECHPGCEGSCGSGTCWKTAMTTTDPTEECEMCPDKCCSGGLCCHSKDGEKYCFYGPEDNSGCPVADLNLNAPDGYTVIVGDCAGNDMPLFSKDEFVSVEECGQLCNSSPSCKGYTWFLDRGNERNCYPKSASCVSAEWSETTVSNEKNPHVLFYSKKVTCYDTGCKNAFNGLGMCVDTSTADWTKVSKIIDFSAGTKDGKCGKDCKCICFKKKSVTKPCKPNKKCAKKKGKCFGRGDTIPKNAKRKGWCDKKRGCKCYKV